MQKVVIVSLLMFLIAAFTVPIFADEITEALDDTNPSTDNSSSYNDTFNGSDNSTLTFEQLKILNQTQNKLNILIAIIESIKAANNSTVKAYGVFNALSQFQKQATRLNETINLFIQNPSINSDGRINSFIKREAALEHKVEVKQQVISKHNSKENKRDDNPKEASNNNEKNNKGN